MGRMLNLSLGDDVARQRVFLVVIFFGIVGFLVVLLANDPATTGVFPPCPFFTLTTLYCPGCGTLRGLHCLLRGDLLHAMSHNLASFVALPMICLAYVMAVTRAFFKWPRRPFVFRPWASWTILGAILVFSILRNIETSPFNALAP